MPTSLIKFVSQSTLMADKVLVHVETHRVGRGQLFRNIILGSQDGIVNVLGIILGVAVSTHSTSIVLLAGLAATFAESISMAAVAFTASRAEQEHYESEVEREKYEMDNLADAERKEVEGIYRAKGFSGKLLKQVVDKICSDKKTWLETMMREELRLENPAASMTPLWQGVLVGGSAIIGSFVPLAPFFFLPVAESMLAAVAVSFALLFLIGAYKSQLTSGKWFSGGFELMVIGGVAALAGYAVGSLFQVQVS